ncbi:Hypothetical protein R9X50_00420800 [Acrodontium crateriforme]|uniref:CENP-V/GFA domain-containing protein n=1 Tax=Acrodontium crateriforme TaxID=150365 RepID=A0AAQ3RA09_9PEZI|nr:Hypothetical protein R9X50_00420800 [Acrodontium crateriforme]
MATNTKDIELVAQCLCKSNTFTTQVSQSSLPLEATFCHCDSCRHLTGAMQSSSVPWPGPTEPIEGSNLAQYEVSEKLTLFFCKTCSSPMFCRWHDMQDKTTTYHVPTGALSNNNVPSMIRVQRHMFVSDARDGGSAVWLQKLDDSETQIPCWEGWPSRSEQVDPRNMDIAEKPSVDDVPVYCHCKGVNLVFRSGAAKAEFSNTAKDKLPWFVDPENYRLLASFDACDSCRISTGADVFNWCFTLLRHLDFPSSADQLSEQGQFPNNTPALKTAVIANNRDPRLGTLTYYSSSPNVQRYFCSKCSATVFYAVDSRPDMVDLAIGLLQANDGARAEGALTWGLGMMVWDGDVKGGWRESFVDIIKNNAVDWRVTNGWPKAWAVIAREKREAAK